MKYPKWLGTIVTIIIIVLMSTLGLVYLFVREVVRATQRFFTQV